MDFIEALPKCNGKDTVFVRVDPLANYAPFMALSHPFIALVVAKLFIDVVHKLQGLPLSIVSESRQ